MAKAASWNVRTETRPRLPTTPESDRPPGAGDDTDTAKTAATAFSPGMIYEGIDGGVERRPRHLPPPPAPIDAEVTGDDPISVDAHENCPNTPYRTRPRWLANLRPLDDVG